MWRQTSSPRLWPDLDVWGAWLSSFKAEVGFVQVGAFDGVSNDPLHDVRTQFGWIGVMVEPLPDQFAKLEQAYGDSQMVLINAAVSDQPRSLWRITGHDPTDLPGLPQVASFDREHVMKHIGYCPPELRPSLERRVVSEPVATITLAEALARCPRSVDVLQIDVEGYDAEIINMLVGLRERPTIVRFEHAHLSHDDHLRAIRRLSGAGYSISVGPDDTLAVQYQPQRGARAIAEDGTSG
jgi:FkbM family methyltransferase